MIASHVRSTSPFVVTTITPTVAVAVSVVVSAYDDRVVVAITVFSSSNGRIISLQKLHPNEYLISDDLHSIHAGRPIYVFKAYVMF